MAASQVALVGSTTVRSKSLEVLGLPTEATDEEVKRQYMIKANEWTKDYKSDPEKDPDVNYFQTLTRAFTFLMADIDEEDENCEDDPDGEFYIEDDILISFLKLYENIILYCSCVCKGCMYQYMLKKNQFRRPERGARILVKPNCCMVISPKKDERKLPRACSHHKGIDEKYQFTCELNGEEIKFTKSVKKKLKQLKPKWQEPEPSVKWFKKQDKKYWNASIEPTVSTYKRPILGLDNGATNKSKLEGSDTESQGSCVEKENEDGLDVEQESDIVSTKKQKSAKKEYGKLGQQHQKKPSKKQLEAEQRKREKEMATIAEELKKQQEKELEKLKKMEEKEKLRQREVNSLKQGGVHKKETSSDQDIRESKRREEKKQRKIEVKSKSKKKRDAKQMKRMENVKKLENVVHTGKRSGDPSKNFEIKRKGSSDSIDKKLDSKKANRPKSNLTSNTAVTQVTINAPIGHNYSKPVFKEPENYWKPIPREVKVKCDAPPKFTPVAPRFTAQREAQMQEQQINSAIKFKHPQKQQPVPSAVQNAWGTKGRLESNIWQERQQFYHAVVPQSQTEEEAMLKAALEMSMLQQEEEKLMRKIADEEKQFEKTKRLQRQQGTSTWEQIASNGLAPEKVLQNLDTCKPVIDTFKADVPQCKKTGLERNSYIAQEDGKPCYSADLKSEINTELPVVSMKEQSDQNILGKKKQLDCHDRLRQFAKSFANDLKSSENMATSEMDELVWEEKGDGQTVEIESESSLNSDTNFDDSSDADDEFQTATSQDDSSSLLDSPHMTNSHESMTNLSADLSAQLAQKDSVEYAGRDANDMNSCRSELEKNMKRISLSETSHVSKDSFEGKSIPIAETNQLSKDSYEGVCKKKSTKADLFGKSLCANVSRLCKKSDKAYQDYEHHSNVPKQPGASASTVKKEEHKSVDIKSYLPPTPPKNSEIPNPSTLAASLGLPDMSSFDGYGNSFHPSMMFPSFHPLAGYNMMPLGVPPIGQFGLPNSLHHPNGPESQGALKEDRGNPDFLQNGTPNPEGATESPFNVHNLNPHAKANRTPVDQKQRGSPISPQFSPLMNPRLLSASMGMFPYLGMTQPMLNMPTINPQLLPSFMTGQPINPQQFPSQKSTNNGATKHDGN